MTPRQEPRPMTAICAWCNTVVRIGSQVVTHTICHKCEDELLRDAGADREVVA